MPDTFAGWIGEEIGKVIYKWITGNDHPLNQVATVEQNIIIKQNEMIRNGAMALYDAYNRGYAIQQEAQLMEAQMLVEGAITAYNYLDETEIIDFGMTGYHSTQAARAFKKSLSYYVAPIPTIIDEGMAIGYIVKGVYHLVKAFWEE